MAKKAPKKKTEAPQYPKVFQFFGEPRELQVYNSQTPTCFNGNVSFRQYRVTVEQVSEPVEVLFERLREMWRKCDNHHHWWPLQAAAKSIGMTLDHDEMGVDRKVGAS